MPFFHHAPNTSQLEIEKLEKERFAADEKKKAVQAVQRLKQKQIALIMQSLADVQATVEEVSYNVYAFFQSMGGGEEFVMPAQVLHFAMHLLNPRESSRVLFLRIVVFSEIVNQSVTAGRSNRTKGV